MAKKHKLVCDRCGLELTEIEEINLALEGTEAWKSASRFRGVEARGVIPCKNYAKCGGELIIVAIEKKKSLWCRE